MNRIALIVITVVAATGCAKATPPEAAETRASGRADVLPTSAPSSTSAPPATTASTTASVGPTPLPTTPVAPEPRFDGIILNTRAGLDDLKVAFDEGHQPWRVGPVETAHSYLRSLGLQDPAMGEYLPAGALRGEVGFDSGAPGVVVVGFVSRNPLPYVVSVRSSRVEILRVERNSTELWVQVASHGAGTLRARAGRFGAEWKDEKAVPATVSGPVAITLRVDDPAMPPILQVRHEGKDGVAGVAAIRVQPVAATAAAPPGPGRLSAGSRLRIDGIGPIDIGMTVEEALAASGVPMAVSTGPLCETLSAPGGPNVVQLIATPGGG